MNRAVSGDLPFGIETARLLGRGALVPHQSVVVSDPEILGGTPCFRGTRVPIDSLIDYLEAGDSLDEFLDNFPSVTHDAAVAALEEAKALLTAGR
ncbi:MAG: DUF433 domain-containing protein [Bryobacteraceae bacterium]|nr:DUF433 domain-containing protein [Bryobacteraceae bacterium]